MLRQGALFDGAHWGGRYRKRRALRWHWKDCNQPRERERDRETRYSRVSRFADRRRCGQTPQTTDTNVHIHFTMHVYTPIHIHIHMSRCRDSRRFVWHRMFAKGLGVFYAHFTTVRYLTWLHRATAHIRLLFVPRRRLCATQICIGLKCARNRCMYPLEMARRKFQIYLYGGSRKFCPFKVDK